MKKVVLVIFLLFCMCLPAYAVHFIEIVNDDKRIIYIDADSIETRKSGNHEYAVAWIKMIPLGDFAKELTTRDNKTVASSMELWAFTKGAKQYQVLSMVRYDKNGALIFQESHPFEIAWCSDIVPQTFPDFFYDLVMDSLK